MVQADDSTAYNVSRYERKKRDAAAKSSAESRAGRDLGDLGPSCADLDRREDCRYDLRAFCETYLGETFGREWSADHLKVIAKLERVILRGGRFVLAMPRGSGKTTLCKAAALWAILYGHCRFVVLIGAEDLAAQELIQTVRVWIEANDLLAEDFAWVCLPVRALEGITQRANGQLHNGDRTYITWSTYRLVLPTIDGSEASGGVIAATSMGGRVRGMTHTTPGGQVLRPDVVLVDDPQDDETAHSPVQVRKRERVVKGAILGLAGPGTLIAALMTVTTIAPDDLAERMLDKERHPQWQAERMQMVYDWPAREDLWERYGELWREEQRESGTFARATEFYREHRGEMDEGSVIAWEQRFTEHEVSALQHAYNLRLDDEPAFFAEYQNQPVPLEADEVRQFKVPEIISRTNGLARGVLPRNATKLTAFIDVQQNVLYYVVCAWEETFSGAVIDYGAYPDQRRRYFSLRDARKTLALASPSAGLEGAIAAGLRELTGKLCGKEWMSEDGTARRVDLCLIDANWSVSTDVVYEVCRQSPYGAQLMPSHGKGLSATARPMSEYKRKPGERLGLNWLVPSVRGKRAIRHLTWDTNWWKSFAAERMFTTAGDRGSVTLYGKAAETHRMFAEHLAAEYRKREDRQGRTVDLWKLLPGGPDNHLGDCYFGCAVAASVEGIELDGTGATSPRRRRVRRVSYSEVAARKRAMARNAP